LRPGLDDTVVLACGRDGLLAFPDAVTNRLFHVNIFARLARPDRHQRVPVIRRGGGDRVDLLAFEKFPNIGITGGSRLAGAGDDPRGSLQNGRIHIAKRRNSYARQRKILVDVKAAAVVAADLREADVLVGPRDLPIGFRRQTREGDSRTQPGGTLQKPSACDSISAFGLTHYLAPV
jgi:hypothetical protein